MKKEAERYVAFAMVVLCVVSMLPSAARSALPPTVAEQEPQQQQWKETKRGWYARRSGLVEFLASLNKTYHLFLHMRVRWTRSEERTARGTQWRESTLFFGLSRQDANGTGHGEVSDEEFYRFVSEVVTPLFPDGLTILDAHGQYLNHHGLLIKEKSKYMIIFHPDEPEYHSKLDRLWQNYTEQFQQESVLVTSTITDFCFNDECLGTPIPNLEKEFATLRAQHNHTVELLRTLETRLATLEDSTSSTASSTWVYAVAAVAVAVAVAAMSFVAYLVWDHRRRASSLGLEENAPLLGHK